METITDLAEKRTLVTTKSNKATDSKLYDSDYKLRRSKIGIVGYTYSISLNTRRALSTYRGLIIVFNNSARNTNDTTNAFWRNFPG